MNHRQRSPLTILARMLMLSCALCGLIPGTLFAASRSVEAILAEKTQWSSYASAGNAMTIEGRVSAISGKQLRFRGCDLPCQAAEGKSLLKLFSSSANVEITGRFALVNTKPTFLIEVMRVTPSDLETFRNRERELRNGKPDEWYGLGDWAVGRGTFYEDDELKRRAVDAYREAIERERQALPADAADALVKLSEKIPKYGLPETFRAEYVHDAWQRRWRKTPKDDPAALRKLAEDLSKELQGCTAPLDAKQAKQGADYLRDPLGVYKKADEETRNRLHRALYAEILRTAILLKAQPDGNNGYEIADELDKLGPEFHDLAETHREKNLDLRISRVKTATRQDVVLLADELRQRQQPEKARKALDTWLAARVERLRKDGPTGLMQAAEDYQSLIDDKGTAVKLLVEAYQIDPSAEPVSQRLKRMGYVLQNGEWVNASDVKKMPDDPVQIALREGRVVAGMTAEQVQKAQGAPDAVARFASFNEVNEFWTYDNVGGVRLVVHIQRRGTAEPRTISISQLKTPPR